MGAWNVVVLAGRLSRPAEQRVLPSGDRLVALQLTVGREGDRAETVPVVWFGAPASAGTLDVDEAVVVVGRVRRRFFRAGQSTQSRTEVVAETAVPLRRAGQARAALATARARLEEAGSHLETKPRRAPSAGRRPPSGSEPGEAEQRGGRGAGRSRTKTSPRRAG